MTDQSFDAEHNEAEDDGADESALYEAMEKRVGGGEQAEDGEGGEQTQNWQEKAEAAEKRFQDQQKRAKAERREKQNLAKRIEELEAALKGDSGDKKPPTIVDPNEDPIGALEAMKALIEAHQKGQQEDEQTAAERSKEQARERSLASTLTESEADFRKLKPDYDKAADFFKKARAQELIEQGYDADDLPQILRKEFLELIERADKTDKDPAEVVYTLAMRRGYSLDAGKQKLQSLSEAQKAGRSLSTAGGRNGSGSELTIASVSQLKGKALLEGFAKLKEQEKRRSSR